MTKPLMAIRAVTATTTAWVPMNLQGTISYAWLDYDGDLQIASDPNDPSTQDTLQYKAADHEYAVPMGGSVSVLTSTPLCYVRGATKSVHVTLYAVRTGD